MGLGLIHPDSLLIFLFVIFAPLSARPSFSLYREEGKSGQQRATHRLMAGSDQIGKTVPQKITVFVAKQE